MEWRYSMPTQPLDWIGQVVLLEASQGESRRECLKQWLQLAECSGAKTWLLSCDRHEYGIWAGLQDLLIDILPQVQIHAPDLIIQHDYELTRVLPALRRTLSVRYPTLTDTAPEYEQVRSYPANRAYRIIHGLIDFLAAWAERSQSTPWVIVCDRFERAGALVIPFFVELMRRRSQQLNLTLLIATDIGASEIVTHKFASQYLGVCVRLDLPTFAPTPVCAPSMSALATKLEQQLGEDLIELEIHLPQLINYWLLGEEPLKALNYLIQACTLYSRRGFYEDALSYGKAALAIIERYCPQEIQKHWLLYPILSTCYITLDKPGLAMELLEVARTKTDDPQHLIGWCFMMAMLYIRHLGEHDLIKGEAYLEMGLEELAKANLPPDKKVFQTVVNRNGLALIRHRQGRYLEAVELCRWCYEQLNIHLQPEQQHLQRSVLLYNIAKVYTFMGLNDEAIDHLTHAMAQDSNYSEYYNDRGNLYFKMGRLDDAFKDYLKAIELSPPYSEVWANLGQCYRLMGDMSEAISAYSHSLDLEAGQFSTLVNRAQAFEMLDQPETALADYNSAIALNPNHAFVLANRAILYYQAGKFSLALNSLNQAIALSPETADLYLNRAIVLISLERGQEAVSDLQTHLQLNPTTEDRAFVEGQLLALEA